MISPGQLPAIPGDLDALAGHAAAISRTGTDFADTGERIDATWQGLVTVYDAPEAGRLFAATSPVRSVSASTGEDITAVGAALAAYAIEVGEIKRQLESLRSQAATFAASVEGVDDWQEDNSEVDRHNDLLQAVNTQMAAFMDAQRRCANMINARYGGQQYRAEDGDGQAQPGEFGYTAEQLNAAAADGGLPWGSAEEHDRGPLGDVGAFFGGMWGGGVQAVTDLGALIGRDPVTGEWGSGAAAGQAWTGVGTFLVAVGAYSTPLGRHLDQTTGYPGFQRAQLGETLTNAGKGLIAYDQWGEDPARAAGTATFNIVSAVVGTKGAGSALRGTGAAVASVRTGAVATRVSSGLIRAGRFLDDLPTVTDLAARVGQRFNIQLPDIGPMPAIVGDVPGGRGFEVEQPDHRGPDGDDPPSTGGVDQDAPRADTGNGDPTTDDTHGRGSDPGSGVRDPARTEPEVPPDVDGNPPDAPSGRPDWLDRFAEGNEFNSRREPYYRDQGGANEVHVEPRTDGGQYRRVDSYIPDLEIVSRKYTQLAEVQEATAVRYLREFAEFYDQGTPIADTPTNRRDLGTDQVGLPLNGRMILEVPVQRGDVPPAILEAAEDLGIVIRDENGRVYELPD